MKGEVEMDKKNSIELKRVVMVKAIVTEAFKDNLVKELDRAVKNLEMQGGQMEDQAKKYMEDLKKKGQVAQITSFKAQLEEEKARQAASKADLTMKMDQSKKLVLGTEFVQGPLEGPVDVSIGDNLYKKVGAAEIIVKDGIIQEIRGTE
jgi:hypothetical protein